MGPLHHRMSHHGMLLIVLPVAPLYVVLQHIAAHCVIIAAAHGVAVVLPYVMLLQTRCHVLCHCGHAAVCHVAVVVLASVVSLRVLAHTGHENSWVCFTNTKPRLARARESVSYHLCLACFRP